MVYCIPRSTPKSDRKHMQVRAGLEAPEVGSYQRRVGAQARGNGVHMP